MSYECIMGLEVSNDANYQKFLGYRFNNGNRIMFDGLSGWMSAIFTRVDGCPRFLQFLGLCFRNFWKFLHDLIN